MVHLFLWYYLHQFKKSVLLSVRHHTYYLCSHHFCWSNVTTLSWTGTYHSNCPSHYHTNEHIVGSNICPGTVGTWKSSCCSNLDNSTQFVKGQQSQWVLWRGGSASRNMRKHIKNKLLALKKSGYMLFVQIKQQIVSQGLNKLEF